MVLRESPSATPSVALLLARKSSGGDMQVFLENSSDLNIKLKGGTFVGRAGTGAFYPVQDAPPAQAAYTWTYTRLTEFKKDTARLASGSVVWSESPGATAPPTMKTLAECEAALGEAALGATKRYQDLWPRNHEDNQDGEGRAVRQATHRVVAQRGELGQLRVHGRHLRQVGVEPRGAGRWRRQSR